MSPWAALAVGLLFYFSDGKSILLLAAPVAVHELGHMLCLRLLGCRVLAFRCELSGLCIRYAGDPGRWGQAAAALAGPLTGLIYAWFAAKMGASGELSAGISVLLSVFNLIPALPLDGGRAVDALLGRKAARRLSLFCSVLTMSLGLVLFARSRGAALALAGLLLLAAQIRQGSSSAISPD